MSATYRQKYLQRKLSSDKCFFGRTTDDKIIIKVTCSYARPIYMHAMGTNPTKHGTSGPKPFHSFYG